MELFTSWYILLAAFLLDFVLGDPQSFPHPIRWMGRVITALEPYFRNLPLKLSISGTLFTVFLILCTWASTSLLIITAQIIHPLLKVIIEILIVYYAISAKSLEKAAMDVSRLLMQNRLADAKEKVSFIIGRDVEKLTEKGVARGAVETVAENFVDGVVSPLFFAALGGAPLAMAYKMVNTLDSMIGYKNEKYKNFGKTAARVDDVANFIPARISIPVISWAAQILSGKGSRAFETAVKEGANHTSPNAGYPEAAFAGALGIKLNGPNYYHGQLVSKPYIGVRFGEVNLIDIKKSCDLMILASGLWLGILCAIIGFYKLIA